MTACGGRPASFGAVSTRVIGALPLGRQPKLLRALQEGEIQPVGAGREDATSWAAVQPAPEEAEGPTLREHLDAPERNLVAGMLARTGGNQSEAARRLGVSRTAFIHRMKRHGLG